MFPAVLFTFYADRFGPSDDVLEEEITERYQAQVKASSQKNKDMQAFFQHAIRKHDDDSVDGQLDEMLKAGKGGKKRMFHVDDKLYGTKEGVEERQRQEEKRKEEERIRAEKKEKSITGS